MKPKTTTLILAFILISVASFAQTRVAFFTTTTYIPPAGITTIKVGATGGGAATVTTAAGGGGGGAYAENPSLAVTPGTSYAVIVGGGGQGGTNGANGEDGTASTFDASRVVAAGGKGGRGATTTTVGAGGTGGASGSSTGTTTRNGGSGAAGIIGTGGGGGGGSAGSTSVGGNASAPTGGTAGTGASGYSGFVGADGGNGSTGSAGLAGGNRGAGGGGGTRGTGNTDQPGGNGFGGRINIEYTCPTYNLTGTSVATYNTGNGAIVTLTSAAANLPVGTYTVTYNLSGANTATGATSTLTVTSAGTGTFVTTHLANLSPSGTPTNITITNLSSGSPASVACSNVISASNTASFNSDDYVALSGGNWTNSSNWSRNGSTSCGCTPSTTSQVTVQIGTIQLNTEPIVIGALNGSATSSNIKATPATAGAVTNFTVGGLNLNTTFAGSIVNNTAIGTSSNINFTKTGTGSLTLSGTNTFIGTTTVSNGTLSLASNTALGAVANTTTVSSGAAININGAAVANAITLGGTGMSSTGALTGTGTASLSGNVTSTSNFSVGGTGTFTLSGIVSGGNRLEKVGSGTLVLSGANTYSNGTKITSGTLALGAAGVLANGGNVDMAGGTFSSGLSTGFNETMNTLSISNTSTLALGTGVHSLNFSGKGSFTSNKVMTITGWAGSITASGSSGTAGKVFVGSTTTSLSSSDLNHIWFLIGGVTYPAIQIAGGEVVPYTNSCPSIPASPSTSAGTLPACDSLTALTSISLLNSTDYGISSASACGNTSVSLGSGSLQNGNASTNIYIKTGETFTMDGSIAASFIGSIYVMAGGTFNLTGDINGGNIYVYGNFNHALGGVARNQGSPSKVYVASGGTYNAGYGGGSYEQGSFGTLYIEGTVNVSTFDKFQANSLTCVNNAGCFNFSSANAINTTQTATTGFQSGPGNGSLYYLQTSCPGTNANFSNSPNLNICAPNIPAADVPCAKFGAATVYYGATCAPSTSNCAGVIALPIDLSFFKATATKEGVATKWGVASQWSSDYFIIERSKNGIDWEQVGTVKSTNEIGKYHEFGLLDENPYSGGSYYRLVEVNQKGEKTTYSVVYVEIEASELEIFSVYPNPSAGDLTIKIVGEDVEYDFALVDVLGKALFSTKLSVGTNSLGSILSTPGVYFARLKIRGDSKVVKIVKE